MNNFLHCGHKHGIICEYHGHLLQLNLQNIDDNFSFGEEINVAESAQFWWYPTALDSNRNTKKAMYLSTAYLSKSDKIFAVYNEYKTHAQPSKHNEFQVIEQSRKCGIFDSNARR